MTPDHMVPGSQVLFIAQNPGPDEEAGHLLVNRYWQYGQSYDEWTQVTPQPLIGATGQLFNNRFLPLTGLKRHEVSLANAIRCRPGASLGLKADALPPITTAMKLEHSSADIVGALRHCRDSYLHIPDSVKTIVTMGRYAMFQLTGIQKEESEYGKKAGVMESWRGYGVDTDSFKSFKTVNTSRYHDLTEEHRVFFTMHIAALFQGSNKHFFHATLQDFHRLRLLLGRQWPKATPSWANRPPTVWPKYSAFDTEYTIEDNTLIRWSLCDTDKNLYCIEADASQEQIPIKTGSTIILQNALADLAHLSRLVDMDAVSIEDMMLAHSVLWTGERHSLNYIQSKYGSLNKYKHLSEETPQAYSAFDAHEPMYMWRNHFIPEFRGDPLSWRVYKKYRLPLINIINEAQIAGVAVDTERLRSVQEILQERIQEYTKRAREILQDDTFNLSSTKRVREALYGV